MRIEPYHRAGRCLLMLLWAAVAASASPVLAQVAHAAAPDSAREQELAEIRDQIVALRARLLELGQRQQGLAGRLDRTNLELQIQERSVAEARTERAIAEAALDQIAGRVEGLRAGLVESRAVLRERLLDLYRLGRHGAMRLLLSIRSDDQLVHGLRLLRYLARREGKVISGYLDGRAELDAERLSWMLQQRRIAALVEREASHLEELRETEARQLRLLEDIESSRIVITRRTATLLDRERKLENLLDFLFGRTPASLAGTPLQDFQGVLDWPIEGRVVTGFGPRRDPRYRTEVPHNGIEIEPSGSRQARAIFPGKVVYAAPFEGYGLTVVVHHPTRVFTLYAGLESLRVGRDDMLSLGQVLGEAETTLYFEIRVLNEPRNPVDWLR